MSTKAVSCASYLKRVFDPKLRAAQIDAAQAIIEDWERANRTKVDAFVGTGVSGATFGSVLAYVMKRHLVVVRKAAEGYCNSAHMVEGLTGSFSWLFVDDLVSSGATLRRVVEGMQKHRPESVFAGIYTYAGDGLDAAGNLGTQWRVPWVNEPEYRAPSYYRNNLFPESVEPGTPIGAPQPPKPPTVALNMECISSIFDTSTYDGTVYSAVGVDVAVTP